MDLTTALVTDLVTLLDQEQSSLEALLHLLAEERRAVRTLSLDRLTGGATAKTRLLDDLHQLERRRTTLVAALAAEWGTDPERLTLTEIAARVPAEEAGRLLRRRDRLQASLLATLDANRFNGSVIARVCRFLEESLSCWRLPAEPGGLYSDAGAARRTELGGQLVERRG
ncbi:flagellar export chaperone FlgN [Nitrospira sp. Kam-Ns4a]